MLASPNASASGADSASADPTLLQTALAAQKDDYLRLAADFDNFKKRTRRDSEQRAASEKESFIQDLLPILDNLEVLGVPRNASGEAVKKPFASSPGSTIPMSPKTRRVPTKSLRNSTRPMKSSATRRNGGSMMSWARIGISQGGKLSSRHADPRKEQTTGRSSISAEPVSAIFSSSISADAIARGAPARCRSVSPWCRA